MKYIDMHCDTLSGARRKSREDIVVSDGSVDAERLYEAGTEAQFFAMFIPQRGDTPDDHWAKMLQMREIFFNSVERAQRKLAFARSLDDIKKNEENGAVSGLLTVENGYLVDGKMDRLKELKELGVSLISLTWNDANCFGACNSTDRNMMLDGLTDFGNEAIAYMNELGIIVDVSHLSDGGFWDVVAQSRRPFVASHSNARELSPHQRNLTDEMIRALADKGGVTGLNFCSNFLEADIRSDRSCVEAMVRHISYIVKVGGIDCMAIGTDFDGIGGTLEIDSPLKMDMLFHALEKEGFSGRDIEKIAYLNMERVIGDTLD